MQKRSDDRLIAYLDGELKTAEQREVEAWLASDAAARERFAALAESANLVRVAFDDVLHEPIPDRLIAAAPLVDGSASRRFFFRPSAWRHCRLFRDLEAGARRHCWQIAGCGDGGRRQFVA